MVGANGHGAEPRVSKIRPRTSRPRSRTKIWFVSQNKLAFQLRTGAAICLCSNADAHINLVEFIAENSPGLTGADLALDLLRRQLAIKRPHQHITQLTDFAACEPSRFKRGD